MSTFSEKWQEIRSSKKKFLVFILLCLLLTCGTGLLVIQGLSGSKSETSRNKTDDKIPTLNNTDTIGGNDSKITTYNDHLKDQEEVLNNNQNQKTDFEKLFVSEENKNTSGIDYSKFGEKKNDYLVKNSELEGSTTSTNTLNSTPDKNLRSRTAKTTEIIIYSQNQMSAVVHNWNREIRSGSNVRIRTTEEFKANGIVIPKNTNLMAVASAQGERMKMVITGANINNEVLPLELEVYDNDGVAGLHIPTHLQREIFNDAVDKGTENTKTTVKLGSFGEVTTNLGSKAKNNPNILVSDGYKIFLKPKK